MNVRNLFAPALVAGLLLGGISASQSQVLFTYTDALTPGTATFGGTVVSATSAVDATPDTASSGGTDIKGGQFLVVSSTTLDPNFDQINYAVTDTFTIFQQAGSGHAAGTGTITINVLLRAQANSTSSLPQAGPLLPEIILTGPGGVGPYVPQSTVIDGVTYTIDRLDGQDALAPAGGTAGGGFSPHIFALGATVPEPGTVAMLVGMGISGSAFVLRRRRATK